MYKAPVPHSALPLTTLGVTPSRSSKEVLKGSSLFGSENVGKYELWQHHDTTAGLYLENGMGERDSIVPSSSNDASAGAALTCSMLPPHRTSAHDLMWFLLFMHHGPDIRKSGLRHRLPSNPATTTSQGSLYGVLIHGMHSSPSIVVRASPL
jgi:hypothetical protein